MFVVLTLYIKLVGFFLKIFNIYLFMRDTKRKRQREKEAGSMERA